MQIISPAFDNHSPIPMKYTCEGQDISPPLQFSDIPNGAKSLALIVDDPDAPRGTFDHWIVWNLKPDTLSLKEGTSVPNQGINHFKKQTYGGPCPPPGSPHRYFFKLYALDIPIKLKDGSTKAQLEEAMEGHVIGRAELVGTYKRNP